MRYARVPTLSRAPPYCGFGCRTLREILQPRALQAVLPPEKRINRGGLKTREPSGLSAPRVGGMPGRDARGDGAEMHAMSASHLADRCRGVSSHDIRFKNREGDPGDSGRSYRIFPAGARPGGNPGTLFRETSRFPPVRSVWRPAHSWVCHGPLPLPGRTSFGARAAAPGIRPGAGNLPGRAPFPRLRSSFPIF